MELFVGGKKTNRSHPETVTVTQRPTPITKSYFKVRMRGGNVFKLMKENKHQIL